MPWFDKYLIGMKQEPELGKYIIVIPTYNRKDLLEEAIESVVAQTYQNWELWILDDLSTDGTNKMVAEFKDSRIKYIYMNVKSNPTQLLELGCRIAMKRGEYWSRLSSDDLFLPEKLQNDIDFLYAHQEFGGCYGPFQKIDIHGRVIGDGQESPKLDPKEMLKYIRQTFVISWANICVRTSVLGRMIRRFEHFSNDSLINMEDWVFNLKMLLVTKVSWVGDKPMAQYRIHSEQATNNAFILSPDLMNSRKIIDSMSEEKPQQTIAEYLGIKDFEYTMQMSAEYGAERSLVLGNDRNWQQSFRAQELIPKDSKLVLDLGCGRGYWTERISTLLTSGKCIGVDAMSEFVERGRVEFKKDFRVMDYHRLEFPDIVFDVVYADNTIEHSPKPDVVFSEIRRVLKKDGLLVLLIPPDKLGYPKLNNRYHLWKVDRTIITEALESNGFKIEEFIEFDLVKEGALLYHESNNLMYIIKVKKV